MYLAQNLKYLRMKSKETQKNIAELLGVSEMTISRYESGEKEPDIKKVILISDHFQISIDELLMVELKECLPMYLKNIKFLRKKHGFTQDQMAELLGYRGKQGYGAMETGVSGVSADHLIKLADYFGISLDRLVKENLAGGD